MSVIASLVENWTWRRTLIAGFASVSLGTYHTRKQKKIQCVAELRRRASVIGAEPQPHTTVGPRHLTVVMNRSSGRVDGRAKRIFNDNVAPIFHLAGIDFTIVETDDIGHAKALTATTLDPSATNGVVVVGGDGMVHEVVTGLMRRPNNDGNELPIGVIPTGRRCGIFSSLVSCSPWENEAIRCSRAALVIAEGYSRKADVLKLQDMASKRTTYAMLGMALGMMPAALTAGERRRWWGDFTPLLLGYGDRFTQLHSANVSIRLPPDVTVVKDSTVAFSSNQDGWVELGVVEYSNIAVLSAPCLSKRLRGCPSQSLFSGTAELSCIPGGVSRSMIWRLLTSNSISIPKFEAPPLQQVLTVVDAERALVYEEEVERAENAKRNWGIPVPVGLLRNSGDKVEQSTHVRGTGESQGDREILAAAEAVACEIADKKAGVVRIPLIEFIIRPLNSIRGGELCDDGTVRTPMCIDGEHVEASEVHGIILPKRIRVFCSETQLNK